MRPLKYGEETVLVPMRLPKSKVKEIKKLVADYLGKSEVVVKVTKYAEVETKVTETTKPKWQIDAEERMKRNKG